MIKQNKYSPCLFTRSGKSRITCASLINWLYICPLFSKKTRTWFINAKWTFQLKLFQFLPKVDPCDPATLSKGALSFPRVQQHSGENRTPGKSKSGKTKGKGKKTQEDDRPTAPVRKLWYEARSPEGYTYYWHIETNGGCTFVEFFFIFLHVCLLDIFFRQTVIIICWHFIFLADVLKTILIFASYIILFSHLYVF